MLGDIEEYIREYNLRIGKLINASFVALVDSVAVWNNEEKRGYVFNYLHEAWKEICNMESCKDYGIPSSELLF